MSYALYVTHPQVVMDPAVATPLWGLSELGRQRAEAFAGHPLLRPVGRIISSNEPKAMQLAQSLARNGARIEIGEQFGETRRTGYLDRAAFEQRLDALYSRPDDAGDGWETANDATRRIVGAVEAALTGHDPAEPVVFTGHGTVGTLLKCHLAGRTPTRAEDQRRMADPGGGNVFGFRLADRQLLHDWVAMEALPEQPLL